MASRGGTAASPVRSAELRGQWTVTFLEGGPVLPKPFTSDTVSTGPVAATRTRTASPVLRATRSPSTRPTRRGAHLLNLGTVHESARVRLNGRELGTLIEPFFSVETGPLRPTGNVLEVEVTNVSANRIRDLDRRGVQWRIFNDINFVGIDYRPFDASRWPVRPSGLSGPVALQPLSGDVPSAAR